MSALLYAARYNCKIIYTRLITPSIIDSDIKFVDKAMNASDLWNAIYFILGISGNIMYADKIENIRIESSTHLNIYTKRARKYFLEYERICVFDDYLVQGFLTPSILTQEETWEIRDWLDVKSGMKHDHQTLRSDSPLVNKGIFYPSERIDGNHDLKDAVAVSYLTTPQLENYEYSDINARFKVLHMMKKAGIRGTRNGKDPISGKPKHYSLKVLNSRREVVPKLKKYESCDKISFIYSSPNEVVRDMKLNNKLLKLIYNYGT